MSLRSVGDESVGSHQENRPSNMNVKIAGGETSVRAGEKRERTSRNKATRNAKKTKTTTATKKNRFVDSALGTLKSIHLENFMCHDHLMVRFGPHLNIVTGRNGSGKSAILAGIQVCLGASAKTTRRGNRIGDMVKNDGGNRAHVTLELNNDGPNAFEPDTYGDTIFIERSIAKKGPSTYKVKAGNGKTISRHGHVVRAICEKFNIQVNNPVCVLDQQSAKSFIQGKEGDKYNFYLRATELKRLQSEYEESVKQIRLIKTNLKSAKAGLPELKARRDVLLEALQRCEELEKNAENLRMKKIDLEWAMLRDAELVLDERSHDVEIAQEKLKRREEKLNRYKEKDVQCSTRVETLRQQVEPEREEMRRLDQIRRDTIRKKQEAIKAVKMANRKVDEVKRSIATCEERRRVVQTQLKELLGQTGDLSDDAKLRTRQREIEGEIASAQRFMHETQARIHKESNTLSVAETRRKQVDDALSQARRVLRVTETELRKIESQQERKVVVYGASMPRLLDAIKRAQRRFHRTPVGPIGMFVNLKERKWARAVERVTAGTLRRFVVHDTHDRLELEKLARQVKCNNLGIIVSSFTAKKIPPDHMIPDRRSFKSIAVVLDVSHDQAWNALIDQCQIEAHVLFDTPSDAERMMGVKQNGRLKMARGVFKAVMPDGMTATIKNGHFSNFRNRFATKPVKYIGVDVKQQILSRKAEIAEKTRRVRTLENDSKRTRQAYSDARNLVQQLRNELTSSARTSKSLEAEAKRLSRQIQQMEEERADIDSDRFMDEIKELDVELEGHQRDLKGREADVEACKEKLAKSEERCTIARDDVEKRDELMEKLRQDLDDAMRTQVDVKRRMTKLERSMNESKDAITSRRAALASQQSKCDEKLICLESKYGKRPENQRRDYVDPQTKTRPDSARVVERAINKLERLIARQENEFTVDDVARMRRELVVAEERYKSRQSTYDEVASRYKFLKRSYVLRKNRFQTFKEHASAVVTDVFSSILRERGSLGKIELDYEHESLEMNLVMNANQSQETISASQVQDASVLSGGERSSVTLALLMALGEITDCPFRLMDELDVYMDPANRQMLMDIIVRTAERNFNRQVILLTPNSIDGMLDAAGDKANMRVLRKENLNILTLASRKKRGGGS